MNSKTCTVCGVEKSLSEFSLSKSRGKSYSRHQCKVCERKRSKRYRKENPEQWRRIDRNSQLRKFGITLEQYEAMERDQTHQCAICGGQNSDRRLAVDHNHATGQVRALLCTNCNQLIGHCKESIGLLAKAALYLQKHNDADIDKLIALLKVG